VNKRRSFLKWLCILAVPTGVYSEVKQFQEQYEYEQICDLLERRTGLVISKKQRKVQVFKDSLLNSWLAQQWRAGKIT